MHPMYIYLNNELHEKENFDAFESQYPKLLSKSSHPGFADSIYTYGLLADYYNKYGHLDRADSIIRIMDRLSQQAKINNDPAWANYDEMLLSTQALNLAYKGDYHGSIEKIRARKTTPRSPSQVNQWLGEIYFRGRQYARAERYLALSIDSFKLNDLINRWPVDAYVFSANALIKLGQLPLALDRLNKATDYQNSVTKYYQRFLYNYYNAWIDYHLALGSARSVIEPFYKKLASLPAMQAMPQLTIRQAEFESLFGDPSKSLPLLFQSLAQTIHSQSGNITLLADIHSKIAQLYYQLDSIALAQNHMIQAISLFTGQPDERSWSTVSWERIPNRVDALGTLDGYFRLLKKGLFASADTAQLMRAASLAKWAMAGILAERNKFLIGDDKSTLIGYNQKIIELGIYTNARLFDLTKDPTYLHSLFEFVESNKSLNLAEEIVRNNMHHQFSASQIESDKIDSFNNLLVKLERAKSQQPNDLTLISRIALLHDSLDHLDHLIPYAKNGRRPALQLFRTYSFNEVLARMTKDLSIIEFYQGIDFVYLLLIQHDRLDIRMCPRLKSLDDLILAYHRALTAPISPDYHLNPRIMDSTYLTSANDLFRQLFGDWEMTMTKNILLIPDGSFHLIPFASLLTAPAFSAKFKELPYWVKDHSIYYAPSASIWMQLSDRPTDRAMQSVMGMAPFADHQLRESAYELEQIAKYTTMNAFLNDQATKQLFCKTAPDYKILHLATHAYSNAFDGASSCISFYKPDIHGPLAVRQSGDVMQPEDSFNYLLDVRDVQNLNLQADMVVLSACESGIGEWKEGEGVISLARGFMSAGARSVVQTLWQVQDKANAYLMTTFYARLKEGDQKSAALRQAQVDYINDKEIGQRQAHPFYWAGVIVQGNNLPLEEKNILPVILILLVLALGLAWIFYKIKRRKKYKDRNTASISNFK